jgi:hypothetical protein
VENPGTIDYRLDSPVGIQVFARKDDGTLVGPVSQSFARLKMPVFIPAKQKATLSLSVGFDGIPTRSVGESDSSFHERLRTYLEQTYGHQDGFVVFDSTNRYEIVLPRWLAASPIPAAR